MKTYQYVYLGIRSDTLSPDEITAILEVEPDETKIKASGRSAPPIPRVHHWNLVCRDPDAHIDEQVAKVVARLRPHAEAIRRLSQREDLDVTLQLVRYFNDNEDGQEDIHGWHLDSDTLAFLVFIGATIDADEYGL
jgi:hypothetical protein